MLDDDELLEIRAALLQHLIRGYVSGYYDQEITQMFIRLTDVKTFQHFFSGEMELFDHLFGGYSSSLDSQRIGSAFLDLLACLGIDSTAYTEREI